jgi:hypothetical protein
VNKAPINPENKAIVNLTNSLDAGPLQIHNILILKLKDKLSENFN